VRGSIAPLIEVGAGINPELTGRENIYLNASILGIPKKTIRQKIDEIIEFSELEQFIDTPVKRYSSGMQVKLGFAIATSLDAEILIIDEVLAVGDLAFQRKCFDRMEELINHRDKTVLVVSHNLRQVQRLSSRVILLDHGRILKDGDPESTCNLFYELTEKQIQTNRTVSSITNIRCTDEVDLLSIQLINDAGISIDSVTYGRDVTVLIRLKVNKTLLYPTISLGVHTTDFLYLATEGKKIAPILEPKVYTIYCTIKKFPFFPRLYSLRLSIDAGKYASTVFYGENLKCFRVVHPEFNRIHGQEGFFRMDCDWKIDTQEQHNQYLQFKDKAIISCTSNSDY
jgi:hypothetical protein